MFLTEKDKKPTFALLLVMTNSQLRKRDLEDMEDNPPLLHKKSNSLDRKLSKRTLKSYDKDVEVSWKGGIDNIS